MYTYQIFHPLRNSRTSIRVSALLQVFRLPQDSKKTHRLFLILLTAQVTECPVIIAPENFDAVDEIIFTYNGSLSSVFAIKQFTYLFLQLYDKKVSIIKINKEGLREDSHKYKFKECLKERYIDLHFEGLKGETDSKLFDYAFEKENIFLVMGAYGRNSLFSFFKRSHSDLLIETVMQPIFITHL